MTENGTRTYPRKRPKNHQPPIPRWRLKFPYDTEYIFTAYIGVQQCSTDVASNQATSQAASLIQSWLVKETASSSVASESFTVLDGDIRASTVWVCYWLDEEDYALSIERLALPSIYSELPPRGREEVGLWCERFVSPISRVETNYTGLDYLPGAARLPGMTTSQHDLTAYWGAARDRIPDSAHNLFEITDAADTAFPNPVPGGRGQHLVGQNYENMVHIRSGQFWESCLRVESQAYEEKLEPALETGLQYLWDNPVESGALGVRYLRNTDRIDFGGQAARKETCAAGFFRSLGDLEHWSKKHPSHLNIYKGALQHAKEFGAERKLRTWHEVSVLRAGDASFEYLNCSPDTGVIRFVRLDDAGLEGAEETCARAIRSTR